LTATVDSGSTGSILNIEDDTYSQVVDLSFSFTYFGVTYTQTKRQRLVRTVRTVGLVTADKGRQWMYVPRTDGYVQKLYITSPGQVVEKGEDLMQVYSPDLATSEQELIKLLENRDRGTSRDIDQLIQSAKRRLRQWNLTDQQIEELEK
jgi:Cu(I)/Ag(I) efflux system membrane fusion protein